MQFVGEVLQRTTINKDLAAWMGVDEFVILLPETNLN
ncbi:MAG: diguanylate cyclase [Halanaerobiales bacterium]|nr:diguanylate cyclase [Halanaerobiales bacterium]